MRPRDGLCPVCLRLRNDPEPSFTDIEILTARVMRLYEKPKEITMAKKPMKMMKGKKKPAKTDAMPGKGAKGALMKRLADKPM